MKVLWNPKKGFVKDIIEPSLVFREIKWSVQDIDQFMKELEHLKRKKR